MVSNQSHQTIAGYGNWRKIDNGFNVLVVGKMNYFIIIDMIIARHIILAYFH